MAEEYEIIQLKAIQVVNDRGSKGHHKELQVYPAGKGDRFNKQAA